MRLFVNVGATPCVIFGPGNVKVAHSADEHVPLGEVEDCARVLAAWLRRELLGLALRLAGRDGARPPRRRASGRDDDERGAQEAQRRKPGRGTTTPEPRLAAAAELQISESVRPWTRVRSASARPCVSIAEPATNPRFQP